MYSFRSKNDKIGFLVCFIAGKKESWNPILLRRDRRSAHVTCWFRGCRNIPSYTHLQLPTMGTNISPLKVAGKMIFLFHRWDMLVPRRVGSFVGVDCFLYYLIKAPGGPHAVTKTSQQKKPGSSTFLRDFLVRIREYPWKREEFAVSQAVGNR